jgi:hypothetical protein
MQMCKHVEGIMSYIGPHLISQGQEYKICSSCLNIKYSPFVTFAK